MSDEGYECLRNVNRRILNWVSNLTLEQVMLLQYEDGMVDEGSSGYDVGS